MAKKNDNKLSLLLVADGLLAFIFFHSVLQIMQEVRQYDMLNSPRWYAGWLCLFLTIYILKAGKTERQRIIAISILTFLITSFLVYVFGASGGGSYLIDQYQF